MRSMCWVAPVLAICGLAGTAAGLDPIGGGCATCNGGGLYAAYAAPACAAPAFGMVEGCWERCSPCCDNAWAGYCQERGWPPSCRTARYCGRPAGCRGCGTSFGAVRWSEAPPGGP
jgi:hypothetical protein